MTRDEILARNPLVSVCAERYGMTFKKNGGEHYATCPFHQDGKRPNFRVNVEKGTWFCDVCGLGGSVIDFVAKRENVNAAEAMRRLSGETLAPGNGKAGKIVANYDYCDETGKLLYQVCRLEPKSFRQRRTDGIGGWAWNMTGVRRVLYRLPEVVKSQTVWIVEGEKDADRLAGLGFAATTNVGGAGKWFEAYSDTLKGKEVVLCGDNDNPGRKHVEKIVESLAGKAKLVRVVTMPAPHKDVSDYLASVADKAEALAKLNALVDAAAPITAPVNVPVYSLADLEADYARYTREAEARSLGLGRWLPTLGRCCRPLVPGELAVVLTDTGVGKTAILQNIALHAAPLRTLLFELELPGTLCFERFVALASGVSATTVYTRYRDGQAIDIPPAKVSHVHVCTESSLTINALENIIRKSELKIGEPPALVLVDYIQLVGGIGPSRYERMSDIAEGLKVLAKSCNVILVAASQIRRREGDSPEIYLHDAKDSGAIENSAGLVLGAWRDSGDAGLLKVKILKNTKGRPGVIVPGNFDGATFRITERAIEEADLGGLRHPTAEP